MKEEKQYRVNSNPFKGVSSAESDQQWRSRLQRPGRNLKWWVGTERCLEHKRKWRGISPGKEEAISKASMKVSTKRKKSAFSCIKMREFCISSYYINQEKAFLLSFSLSPLWVSNPGGSRSKGLEEAARPLALPKMTFHLHQIWAGEKEEILFKLRLECWLLD